MIDKDRLDTGLKMIDGLTVIDSLELISFLEKKILEHMPEEIRPKLADLVMRAALGFAGDGEFDPNPEIEKSTISVLDRLQKKFLGMSLKQRRIAYEVMDMMTAGEEK
jgi:hypothetical protein